MHLGKAAVQAADHNWYTLKALFMGLNVIRKKGHSVSANYKLETLMYVFDTQILSGGILLWRHMDVDDHNLTAVKYGLMASQRKVPSHIPKECWDVVNRLRKLILTPGDTHVTYGDTYACAE